MYKLNHVFYSYTQINIIGNRNFNEIKNLSEVIDAKLYTLLTLKYYVYQDYKVRGYIINNFFY